MNDNLPELRDIHLPDAVSPWPPAYGWYLIILSAVALYCFYRAYKIWQARSRKNYATQLINQLDINKIILSSAEISEILRRICVYRYPEAVALEGKNWLDFLKSKTKAKLSAQAAELLKNAPYMKVNKNYTAENMQELKDFALFWVGENL